MQNRTLHPALIALLASAVIGLVLLGGAIVAFYALWLGVGNYEVQGHQECAKRGVAQIAPASEMDQLFSDCRHFITYRQRNTPIFNSVAYFGGRYELTMQVPVQIKSAHYGFVTGEPRFYLNEVDHVTIDPSGQVGASFSRDFKFGAEEWSKLVEANGDFSAIGFTLNPKPVANFQKYVNADRR